MSDQAAQKKSRAKEAPREAGVTAWLITTFGGIATVGAALALFTGGASPVPELNIVPAAEIADATATLAPGPAAGIADQARKCVAPMAYVTIGALGDHPGATIRLRSGNYLSPSFSLDGTPKRIAIPFPAPYSAGHGVLTVEGDDGGAFVSLDPVWRIASLKGPISHNVVWKPIKPC
jgi:hypothetical protein